MTNDEMRELLERTQTIAVVGMSHRAGRPAHDIPKMLMQTGFTVIPVNPNREEILGLQSYPSLVDVPVPIDLVDVFRRSEHTPDVARDAVAASAKAIWLQLGIVSDEARAIAEAGGLQYVEDVCLGVAVRRFGIRKH